MILLPEVFKSVVGKKFPLLVLSKDHPGHYCKFREIYETVPNPSYQTSPSSGNDGKFKTRQASSLLVPA